MKYFNIFKVLVFFSIILIILILNINTLIKNDGTKISYIDNKTIESFTLPNNKEEIFQGSYFTKTNNILSDNFLRRDSFIEEYFIINRTIGKNIMNNILIDKEENLQYYFSSLSDVEKKEILQGLDDLSLYFENKNYYMFKIPSKNSVYKEQYYDYVVEEESKYVEEISNYIVNNLNIEYYDLNNYIRSFNEEELYYKTDHHWNNIGSFYGYEYIYNILKDKFNLSDKRKIIKSIGYDDVFSGSRARPIGYGYRGNQNKDDFYYNISDDTNEYTMTIYGTEYSGGQEVFYFKDILDDIEKYENLYGVFMGGDYSIINIVNETTKNEDTLLIFKDSFSNAMLPYISSHFKNTIVVDLRYTEEGVSYYVEEYEPDVTLQIFSNFKVMDMYKN